MNYNQHYQNLVERVEGYQLNSITSTVAMELYLGSIIEPIRKSIRNTLYFKSKHAPRTLGEVMQIAQNLYVKHLYAVGQDQQDSSSTDVLPEITVNEMNKCENIRENRGWHKNRCENSDYLQNLREVPRQNNYMKKVTFSQPYNTQAKQKGETSDYLSNLQTLSQTETENNKS